MEKYKELHQELINLMVRYHNNTIKYFEKPSNWRADFISTDLYDMYRLIREMKKVNIIVKKELLTEKRKLIAERKHIRELKKEKRKNGNNKTN